MSYDFWGQRARRLAIVSRLFQNNPLLKKLSVTFLLVLALVCGALTYRVFSSVSFDNSGSKYLVLLLNLDLVILLTFVALVLKRLTRLWVERKTGNAAAKMHSRFTVLFGLVAITPAILMTIFSGFFFNMGLQQWFSQRIKTALNESTHVAEAYLGEHTKLVGANVENMAMDLAGNYYYLKQDPQRFNEVLNLNANIRNLDEVLVFDENLSIVGKSRLSFSLAFETFTAKEIEQASRGTFIKQSENGEHVRALRKLAPDINAYLLVGRAVDPAITKRIKEVNNAKSDYRELEENQSRIQLQFTLMFIAVAMLLLFSAVWVGLIFASRIAKPIGELIDAAGRVQDGDYSTKVVPSKDEDEIASLMIAFNSMTERISEQKQKLLQANRENEHRRRFIENVLDGVSHGVISLSSKNDIQVINRAALEMLNLDESRALNHEITEIYPEIAPLLEDYLQSNKQIHSREIRIPRRGELRTLFVRIAPENNDPADLNCGSIITFADVTELVSAQRKAAWADVARRIAHEIRNPLTPIQLSAERLARKYAGQVTQEPEKFKSCVETIIRQVEHIGDMVKEFSDFARLPEPKMKPEDLVKILHQHVDQYRTSTPTVHFDIREEAGHGPFLVLCDVGQVSQVISNGIQNALDALEEGQTKNPLVRLSVSQASKEFVDVCIEDNGPGFPTQDRDLLTEPYETRKEKGTGLGLAIVKKIVEDHGGKLTLSDSKDLKGACLSFTLRTVRE